MTDPHITMVPVSKLRAHPQNSRLHTEEQIGQIARSIETFGFTIPILIDENKTILAGHGRLAAAQHLGVALVPCVEVRHLTNTQKRAYMIADNKLAQNAQWNVELLSEELKFLSSNDVEFDDVTITGFETPEIDVIIDGGDIKEAGLARAVGSNSRRNPAASPDIIPDLDSEGSTITSSGDLWQLGPHRLLCADALREESYDNLFAKDEDPTATSARELASLVFCDPPYNLQINGHVGGRGKIRHREFVNASGEMNSSEFTHFLTGSLRNAVRHSSDGAVLYACMDWRHAPEILDAGQAVGLDLLNLCVWVKPVGGMGSLYRSRHELVFVFRNGKASHQNNVLLGSRGRNRTNVWEYPGIVGSGSRGRKQLEMHPTVKPVPLVADALRDTSRRGDIVFDPFAGSGTTLIACERTGRRARLIEIDRRYCDLIIRRWEAETGKHAVHAVSGHTFQDLAKQQADSAMGDSNG